MPFHVLTAEFLHESNAFKRGWTELRDYEADTYLIGEKAIAARGSANTEIAVFPATAQTCGWQMTHVLSAHAQPASPLSQITFDQIVGQICAAAQWAERLDGILLGLHGAMVTEGHEDGEGALLARLRAIVGPDLPIAMTLDLQANAMPQMAELADIVVSYKTYPHIDMRERGLQAGLLLDRAMKGEIAPKTLRAHRPMLDETNGGRSDKGPMVALYATALAAQSQPGLLAVSINAGFGDADIRHVGPATFVTHDTQTPGAEAQARNLAEGIMDVIWQGRFVAENTFLSVSEAVAIAKDFDPARRALIIANYADNPGSGAHGDATNLLAAMLNAGLANATFAPVIDPEAAAMLTKAGEGAIVSLALGGKCDPVFGGGPLAVTGTVILVSDGQLLGDSPMIGGLSTSFGPTVVFRVDGIDILVVTERAKMLDQQQFKAFGIEPAQKSIMALKSMQHFRAAFEPIAGRVIVCDGGAPSTPRAHLRPYRRVPRPIFPLDPDMQI